MTLTYDFDFDLDLNPMFSVHLSANYFSDLKSPKKSVVSKKAVASA